MNDTPQGVVAILVTEDGREIANATDFHAGAPGGFEQLEAQIIRARRMLALKAMNELASPLLSNAIEEHHARSILQRMCELGCKVVVVPVGYAD